MKRNEIRSHRETLKGMQLLLRHLNFIQMTTAEGDNEKRECWERGEEYIVIRISEKSIVIESN